MQSQGLKINFTGNQNSFHESSMMQNFPGSNQMEQRQMQGGSSNYMQQFQQNKMPMANNLGQPMGMMNQQFQQNMMQNKIQPIQPNPQQMMMQNNKQQLNQILVGGNQTTTQ